MIRVSCSTKFHAFALTEQLNKHDLLDKFYTLYFSKKNTFFKRFHHRVDKEIIPPEKVNTFPFYLPIFAKWNNYYKRAVVYDYLVSNKLRADKNYKVFIGWSSMSLLSAKQAKKDGKKVLIERGSSHIQFQNQLLKKEYLKYGINFSINPKIIDYELAEYDIADFVVVPSGFVKQSFLEMGYPEEKLFVNNYGSSAYFKPVQQTQELPGSKKFTILYLGGLSIRKGLIYFFEALKMLSIPPSEYEVWFIGSINKEMEELVSQYAQRNWKFFGHINHYELSKYIYQCDVGVQPSIEEGLSMVIPQMLSCGIPVIASTNSGGMDIIKNGVNGYIVPICDKESIAFHIEDIYNDKEKLNFLKQNASAISAENLTWDSYGNRYASFIKSL